jgi:hypothetical protein
VYDPGYLKLETKYQITIFFITTDPPPPGPSRMDGTGSPEGDIFRTNLEGRKVTIVFAYLLFCQCKLMLRILCPPLAGVKGVERLDYGLKIECIL